MGECIIVRQKLLPLLKTAAFATAFLGVPVTVDPVFDCTVASPSQPPSPSPPSPSPPPPPASPAPIVTYIIAIDPFRVRWCANVALGDALDGNLAVMNGNALDGSLGFLEKRIGIAACLGIPGDDTAGERVSVDCNQGTLTATILVPVKTDLVAPLIGGDPNGADPANMPAFTAANIVAQCLAINLGSIKKNEDWLQLKPLLVPCQSGNAQ